MIYVCLYVCFIYINIYFWCTCWALAVRSMWPANTIYAVKHTQTHTRMHSHTAVMMIDLIRLVDARFRVCVTLIVMCGHARSARSQCVVLYMFVCDVRCALTCAGVHGAAIADDQTVATARPAQIEVCVLDLNHSAQEILLKVIGCSETTKRIVIRWRLLADKCDAYPHLPIARRT